MLNMFGLKPGIIKMKKIIIMLLIIAAQIFPQHQGSSFFTVYSGSGSAPGGGAPIQNYSYFKLTDFTHNNGSNTGSKEIALYDNAGNVGLLGAVNGQKNIHGSTGTATGGNGTYLESPAVAADGSVGNTYGWMAAPANFQFWTFQFTTPPTNPIVAYSVWCANTITRSFSGWKLYASYDGITWTLLETRSGITYAAGGTGRNFVIGE